MKALLLVSLALWNLSPGIPVVQERPTPLGGFDAIKGALLYPAKALLCRIGGRVIRGQAVQSDRLQQLGLKKKRIIKEEFSYAKFKLCHEE